MKVNAGGLIAPDQVIGRDTFIQNLWKTIEQQSVILTSERRIGKTSVIRKMHNQPAENNTVVFRDVEGISTIKEFVNRLIDDLSEHQSKLGKGISIINSVKKELSDWKILGITIPKKEEPEWTSVLERLITGLAECYQKENKRLVLIWDEFPWMLQKIIKNEGEMAAANLLDNLRLARQKHISIRMMFTGSIGLHHVLDNLKESKLANEPVNDMKLVNLPPLKFENAKELANQLLQGEDVNVSDEMFVPQLVQVVDCVPYYIHHIITSILNNEAQATLATINEEIKIAFADANDPWNLRHYDTRLKEYYGDDFVFYQVILDILAAEEAGVTHAHLTNLLAVSPIITSDERLNNLLADSNYLLSALRLLAADHYLVKDPDTNAYSFAFPLIKKWWSIHRG